jgi:alanine racemase
VPPRLQISLGALLRNAATLRQLVAPSEAAFVVKGNAYGHGLVPVAETLAPLADRLCVFTFDEALALREAGIPARILVLGPIEPSRFDELVEADVEISLWNQGGFARRLSEVARRHRSVVPVHVKVNTDLNRLGIAPTELPAALEEFAKIPEIAPVGIFSHLASAEEIDAPYTARQLAALEEALAESAPVIERYDLAPLRHIAASAAAMLWPQTRLDMVRFGIAVYGLGPSRQTTEALRSRPIDLEPALSYHSELVVVRTVEPGAAIGYGGSFHAPREMRIGVIAAGYADGIPRLLSNRGAFCVEGALCPIVGRVAMNLTQIDLTNAPNAHVGSKVTLIGRDGDVAATADDWAQWAETINYEIVTRLPSTLPRDYVEGEDRP